MWETSLEKSSNALDTDSRIQPVYYWGLNGLNSSTPTMKWISGYLETLFNFGTSSTLRSYFKSTGYGRTNDCKSSKLTINDIPKKEKDFRTFFLRDPFEEERISHQIYCLYNID